MNEHDEYMRHRKEHDPVAVRWVCVGLVLFWGGLILGIWAAA